MSYKSKKTWTYVLDYSSKDGAKHQQEISLAYVENDEESQDKWTFRFEFHDYVTGKIYLLDSLHDILGHVSDHRHEHVDSYLEEITKNGLVDNPDISLQVTKLPMGNPKLYSVQLDRLPPWMRGPYDVVSAEDLCQTIRSQDWYDKNILWDIEEMMGALEIDPDSFNGEKEPDDDDEDDKDLHEEAKPEIPSGLQFSDWDGDPTGFSMGVPIVFGMTKTHSYWISQFIVENILKNLKIAERLIERYGKEKFNVVYLRKADDPSKINDPKIWIFDDLCGGLSDKFCFRNWAKCIDDVTIQPNRSRHDSEDGDHLITVKFKYPAFMYKIRLRDLRNVYHELCGSQYLLMGSSKIIVGMKRGEIEMAKIEWDAPFITQMLPHQPNYVNDTLTVYFMKHYTQDGIISSTFRFQPEDICPDKQICK